MMVKIRGEVQLANVAATEKAPVFRLMDVPRGSESRDLREAVRSTLVKILVLIYSRRHEDVKKVAA